MGYSLSILALQSADPDAALAKLSVVRTGEHCGLAEAEITGYALPSGWYLIVSDRCDRFLQAGVLKSLSEVGRIVACSIEEHVMFSSAEEWLAGKCVWKLVHVGEKGPVDLRESGSLPSSFQSVKDKLVAQQDAAGGNTANVDQYFDIPLQTAKAITGFKHDEAMPPGVDDCGFEVLREAPSRTSKSWWQVWK